MEGWLSPATPIDNLALTFVDVETTGLSPARGDRVCEIALLRIEHGNEVARFESLVHPQRHVPQEVVAVHGLTDAILAEAPPFLTLLPTIGPLLYDTVLVGHNVRFDLGFLRHEWHLAEQTLPPLAVIDTLALAQAFYRFQHNSLAVIAGALGVPHRPQHRAMADVLATRDVFERFLADLRQRGPVTLAQLMYPSSRRSPTDLLSVLRTLQQALPLNALLHLRYRGWKAPETVRIVEPLEVYYEHGYGFLRAFCHLRREERSFRFDRIAEVRFVTEE